MLNSKKIISAVLAFSMVAAFPASVCSAETDPQSAMICSTDSKISPRWTYTSWVGAGFAIKGEYGKCIGSYELYDNLNSEITVTLMKSKDGMSWTSVEHWSNTNTSCIPSAFSKMSTNKLEHGYYYLAHVQVQVLDDYGNVLETGNSESSASYYE